MRQRNLLSVFLLIIVCGVFINVSAKDPKHGWLRTYKNYLLNEEGNIVQLRGLSMYWSTPGWIGYDWYNNGTIDALVDTWKCNVVRVAWDHNNGQDQGGDKAQAVIDYCIQKGIYVLIDWHSHTAHQQESQAVQFFTSKAQQYKDVPNVIFEIYNEPIVAGDATPENGSVANARLTWVAIKPYLTNVTKAIRNTGSKNIVLLGTPYYCQHVGVAAEDPVLDNGKPFENVMYSFHFYAASHGPNAMYVSQDGGGMEATYLETGMFKIPVFVSEWGTCHRDGGQSIDETNTHWWFDEYIDKYHLSWCNWSASRGETSSAFGGSATSPSASGSIVKQLLNKSEDEWEPEWKTGLPGPADGSVFDMPVDYHPAASYNRYYGASVEAAPAGYSYRDEGDRRLPGTRAYDVLQATTSTEPNWASYKIKSSSATQYILFRYLAPDASAGKVEILVDEGKTGEVDLSSTDGKNWKYAVVPADISTGEHDVKFNFIDPDGVLKIEWFELTDNSEPPVVGTTVRRGISTLPVGIIPSENSLTVTLPPDHGYTRYSIFSANGRVVKSETLENGIRFFNADHLSNGMWFVKLEKNGSQKLMKTFVGNR